MLRRSLSRNGRFVASLAVLLATPTLAQAPSAPPEGKPPAAAPAEAATLEAIARDAVARSGLPGLAIAVVDRDGVVSVGVAGVRIRDGKEPIEAGDRFHLGSCTKAFTATLGAILVAEGKLRWEATVGEILGSTYPDLEPGWKDVTLADLLHHKGGAPTAADREAWAKAWTCSDPPQACRAAFVGSVLRAKQAQPRGSFAYSNQGYAIAGRMCEIAGGASWETLVVERITKPLGMTTVGFGPPTKATDGHAPAGHGADGKLLDIDNPAAIAPAGTMHMSLADWGRFVAMHVAEEPRGGIPLRHEDFVVLHQAPAAEPRVAMGWFRATRPWGGEVLTHSGSNNSWFCTAWLAPEKGFAVLIAANQGGPTATKACDEAAGAAIRWWSSHRPAADQGKKTGDGDTTPPPPALSPR